MFPLKLSHIKAYQIGLVQISIIIWKNIPFVFQVKKPNRFTSYALVLFQLIYDETTEYFYRWFRAAFIDQMQMKIGRDREYEAGAICLEILQNQNTNTHTHTHVYRLVYVVMHLKFHLNSECQNRREKILVKNMTLIMHTGCCFDSKLKCNKNKISCLPISFSTRLPVRLRMCSLSLSLPYSTTLCLSHSFFCLQIY